MHEIQKAVPVPSDGKLFLVLLFYVCFALNYAHYFKYSMYFIDLLLCYLLRFRYQPFTRLHFVLYFSGYKTEFFHSKIISTNLDPSYYKTDIDLCDCLRRVKLVSQQNFIGLIRGDNPVL